MEVSETQDRAKVAAECSKPSDSKMSFIPRVLVKPWLDTLNKDFKINKNLAFIPVYFSPFHLFTAYFPLHIGRQVVPTSLYHDNFLDAANSTAAWGYDVWGGCMHRVLKGKVLDIKPGYAIIEVSFWEYLKTIFRNLRHVKEWKRYENL